MRVVDVFEAELLEHLSRLEVRVDDAGGDVLVEFSQSLRHNLDDKRAEATALEAFVDLKRAKRSHLDSEGERRGFELRQSTEGFRLPQAPGNKLVVFLGENSHVHVHFNQALDEVERPVVLVWPNIINLLALFWYQLLQVDAIGSAIYATQKSIKYSRKAFVS
jgi:hypothetical protein